MAKSGHQVKAWKVQRALMCELPGMGKPGAMERRAYPPGQHGMARKKFSDYGQRLKEKQKLLYNYGLREKQLRLFVKRAKKSLATDWMTTLAGMLETRLDAVVFRLGFAPSIPAARQLVTHRKVFVNGKRLTIPSALVPVGATIRLAKETYQTAAYQISIKQPRLHLPDWLQHVQEGEETHGKLRMKPGIDAIPFPFDARLVAEHYSKV